MKLFGLTVPFTKAPVNAVDGSMIDSRVHGGSWLSNFGSILEPFSGAWQKNVKAESTRNILAFSAVYAAIAMQSNDVAKMRIKLVEQLPNGIWREVMGRNSPFQPVLRKPNGFQTRIQFFSQWMHSLLLYGNTYVLLQRDERRVVREMFVLDPRQVTPKVSGGGAVYYELKTDNLAGLGSEVTLAASEIIHDRINAFFHPLIGISPIYACGASATQGIRIQANSANFFENMSVPSMVVSAPTPIPDDKLKTLKETTERKVSGVNLGRILFLGGNMKAEMMTIPPADAQLIEQLKWTVEDVARAFGMPLHKLASANAPSFNNIGALNQDYYAQCIQIRAEAIEILLDEGLGLDRADSPNTLGTEFDLDGLLRMDPKARAETYELLIRAGVMAPNEARLKEDLQPKDGGDSPMMQQQNWSLEALADRPAPSATGAPTAGPAVAESKPAAANDDDANAAAQKFMASLVTKFTQADHADL